MPKGDPDVGRKAFLALGCNSCHKVMTTQWTAGYQATSILAPSHLVSYQYLKNTKKQTSPMPDLTETMTVRQLIDLFAYLRPPEKAH